MKKKRIRRLARPTGLTLLAQTLHNAIPIRQGTLDKKQEINNTHLEEHIHKIFQYMLANKLTINGQTLSLATLANLLNMPLTTVYKLFINYQDKLSKVFFNNASNASGALFFFASEKILESHAQMQQQRAILQRSQGGQYRPFITSSVNESLRDELNAGKAILDLYKAVGGGPKTAIQINNNSVPQNDPKEASKNLISQTDAIKILEEQGLLKIGYSEDNYKAIKGTLPSDLPEVRATHQEAVKTDSVPMLLPGTIPHASEGTEPSKVGHLKRRQVEEDIDAEDL